jgi:hypothetical protein
MTITNEKFYNAFIAAKRLMKDGKSQSIMDKLSYACKRFTEKNQSRAIEIETKLADIETKHCSTDDKGNILLDAQGRLMFTKESDAEAKAEKKTFLNTTITLSEDDVYITTDNTRVATLAPEWEILNGLVFKHDFWEGISNG